MASGKLRDCLSIGVSHTASGMKPNSNACMTKHPEATYSRPVSNGVSGKRSDIGDGAWWRLRTLRSAHEEYCGTQSDPESLLHPRHEVESLPCHTLHHDGLTHSIVKAALYCL